MNEVIRERIIKLLIRRIEVKAQALAVIERELRGIREEIGVLKMRLSKSQSAKNQAKRSRKRSKSR